MCSRSCLLVQTRMSSRLAAFVVRRSLVTKTALSYQAVAASSELVTRCRVEASASPWCAREVSTSAATGADFTTPVCSYSKTPFKEGLPYVTSASPLTTRLQQ